MNRNGYDKDKWEGNWIIQTIIFDIVVIILFFLMRWNILAGFLILLLLICTTFIGRVLEAYTRRKEDQKSFKDQKSFSEPPLSEKQKKDSQSLLRYATAILAFLSLITTANGMNSFVFTESWMGYLGSFAIQSVLAVFSLLLCRFYVQITMLSWQIYIKRLVNGLLTLFFVIALIISSTFSYTYIANNAYADTWSNDSEFIIQKYLTSTVYQIQEKNDNTGKNLLNDIIENANNQLSPAMEKVYDNEINEIKKDFNKKLNNIVKNDYKKDEVDIDASHLYGSNIRDNEMLDSLINTYNNSFKQKYVESIKSYNEIINEINIWKDDYEDIISNYDIKKVLSEIKKQKTILKNLNTTIGDWKSYKFQKDLDSFRSQFKVAAKNIIAGYKILQNDLKTLQKLVKKINEISKSTTQKKLDNILSQIYLLGTLKSYNSYSKRILLGY